MNYLKMNEDKCHLLVPKHNDDVYIRVNEETIKGEKTVKLLGITLNNKMNFNDHVTKISVARNYLP